MSVTLPNTRKIAITGVNNFPGKQLLVWADQMIDRAEGPFGRKFDEIIAIDIRPPKEKLLKTRYFNVDLTQTDADQKLAEIFRRENVKELLHLAFQTNPTKETAYAHELHSIGTMYLLNACAHQKIEKIVVHSSSHCYGAFPNNPNFLSENHSLRGGSQSSFIRDRIDVEHQMRTYQKNHPEGVLTIIRPCAILGPHINNFATRYLSRKICLVPMGYDPLIQLVHEEDVLRAFQMVLETDFADTFNIVGEGVLPLLTLLQIGGRIAFPLAGVILYPMVKMLWQANFGVVPPAFLNYLKYLCVADGHKAKTLLGFKPKFSTRDTLLSFVQNQRLARVHLATA